MERIVPLLISYTPLVRGFLLGQRRHTVRKTVIDEVDLVPSQIATVVTTNGLGGVRADEEHLIPQALHFYPPAHLQVCLEHLDQCHVWCAVLIRTVTIATRNDDPS